MKSLWWLLAVVILMAIILPIRIAFLARSEIAPGTQTQVASQTNQTQPVTPVTPKSQPTASSTPVPTLLTSDTQALLKQTGKQVIVTGTVTHIELTEPQSLPNETWTLVFFNPNLQSDVPSSSRGRTSPWEYTTYFRLIMKQNIADSLSASLLKGKTLTARGIMSVYLGAPVIYIESPAQVTITGSNQAQNSPLKFTVVLPEKMYFENTAVEEISIQNVSNSTLYNIVLYESGSQFLWKPTCMIPYQGGARVDIGDLEPGKSINLHCRPTLFAQYDVPVQSGQHVAIELSCDSSDSYDQHLATITLTLDPSSSYFFVEVNYDKREWQ
jgi:hypothetical protein